MNTEKLKGYLEKVKTALGKVSKKIWILIAALLVVLAVGVVIFLNTRPYVPLIQEATAEEAGSVVSWLNEQGVTDYRLEGTGTVLVPEAQAANLKARLLMAQHSGTSSPYSGYFDRISSLSTQTDREVAKLAAEIESLEETIKQFENVMAAKVTINPGEDRRYVLDDSNIVSASVGVVLTMRNGTLLTTEQANAIRNYISHSVAGVEGKDVSIEDTWGNVYDSFTSGVLGGADSSALKLQLEQQISNRLRNQIMHLFVPAFGDEDDVRVTVNLDVDVSDTTIEDHNYYLDENAVWTESGGAGIIGRRVYGYQVIPTEDVLAGGLVGTESNSELPTDVERVPTPDDYTGRTQGDGSLDYVTPEKWIYTVRTAGEIKDCTVSIMLNSREIDNIGDVNELRRLVANAVGITPVATEEMTADEYLSWKITIVSRDFPVAEEPTVPEQPDGVLGVPYWAIIALCAGLLVFVLLLTIILLIRRRRRKKQEAEEQAVAELLSVAMPGNGEPVGADVMDLHTEKSMELRQSIREYVDENTEVAALLVRSWLKGDDDNG